jgi:hypothetical protein
LDTKDYKGKKEQFVGCKNMFVYHCAVEDCKEFAIVDDEYETPDARGFYEVDGAWYCAEHSEEVEQDE